MAREPFRAPRITSHTKSKARGVTAPEGNYQKLVGVTAGRIDPVPGCAVLVVDVDALWAELARLGKSE